MKTRAPIEYSARMRAGYIPDTDCFTSDSEIGSRIKKIIHEKLTVSEQTLFILYAEYRSLRRLADHFHVSKTTVRDRIAKIKYKIKKHLI